MSQPVTSHAFCIALLTADYHNPELPAEGRRYAQTLLAVAARECGVQTILDAQLLARDELRDMLAALEYIWQAEHCEIANTEEEKAQAAAITAGLQMVTYFTLKLEPLLSRGVPGDAQELSETALGHENT